MKQTAKVLLKDKKKKKAKKIKDSRLHSCD